MSNSASDIEKGGDRPQAFEFPPVVPQRYMATPAPLGLLSFATSIFLIGAFGLQARDVSTPNVMIGVLLFFGGICQFIAGIMELVAGNKFTGTVFPSYAAFNFAYAMIYLPGTGIQAAYQDPQTGVVGDEFNQALGIFIWGWFILTMLFTVGALRTNWILFVDFVVLDICLILLAAGFMTGIQSVLTAGYSFAMAVAFFTYWAGCAGLWTEEITPAKLPLFAMQKTD